MGETAANSSGSPDMVPCPAELEGLGGLLVRLHSTLSISLGQSFLPSRGSFQTSVSMSEELGKWLRAQLEGGLVPTPTTSRSSASGQRLRIEAVLHDYPSTNGQKLSQSPSLPGASSSLPAEASSRVHQFPYWRETPLNTSVLYLRASPPSRPLPLPLCLPPISLFHL